MALSLPLKKTRTVLLGLATVSCIIAGAAGVNAIRKSDAQKAFAKKNVPAGVTVTISTPDIEDTIIVLFVATNLLSMQIGNFLLMVLKDWYRPYWPPRMTHPRNGVLISTRTLGFQSWYMALNLCAILAALFPATLFAARRTADVKAFLGGVQLPASTVQSTEASLGFAGVYWHYFPVRFVIVSNWINVLFTLAATIASFIALSRRSKFAPGSMEQGSNNSVKELKTHGDEHVEVPHV